MTEERTRLLWSITFATKDPNTSLLGTPVPVMTSLLHRVCDNDDAKFTEADRLIALLLNAALDKREEELRESWRCFHCDEVFTDREAATLHFGPHQECTPICQVAAETYRKMEREVESYRNESDAHSREFYALGSKHSAEMRNHGDFQYAKGLSDARNPHLDEVFMALKTSTETARMTVAMIDEKAVTPDGVRNVLMTLAGEQIVNGPENPIQKAITAYEGILNPPPEPSLWRTDEGREHTMGPKSQGRIISLKFRIGYPGSRVTDYMLEGDDAKKPFVVKIPNDLVRKQHP